MSGLTDRLRQVAGQATPGPWERLPLKNDVVGPRGADGGAPVVGYGTVPANSTHIATFDPVLVSAMLDVIDLAGCPLNDVRMKRALARFREVSA